MKKRLFSLLLVFAMVLTMLPSMVLAEEHTEHCICGATHKQIGTHTEKAIPDEWKPIKNETELTSINATGYYYLTNDIYLSGRWNVKQNREIVLCLNGHDIIYTGSTNDTCIYITNTNFTLTDCKNDVGKITGGKGYSSGRYGGGVHLSGNTTPAEFTMFNGMITNNSAQQGGGVYLNTAYAKFCMYGGEITGNTASNFAGGVYVGQGTFEVAGAPVVNNNNSTNAGSSFFPNKMYPYVKNIYLNNNTVVIGNGGLNAGAALDVTPMFPVSSTEAPKTSITIATGCNKDYSNYFSYTSIFRYAKKYDESRKEVQFELLPYEVKFDMQGHGQQIESQNIHYGQKASEPTIPSADGYTFGGWYSEKNCPDCPSWDCHLWDFTYNTIKGDTTLYAKWVGNKCSVSLDLNGGTIADGKNITEYTCGIGSALPTANDVTKTDFLFDGWYEDSTFSGTAVTEIPVTATGDKIYYAKWVSNKSVTVEDVDSFEITVAGLNNIADKQTVAQGSKRLEIKLTVKEGYNSDSSHTDMQKIEEKASADGNTEVLLALDIDLTLHQYDATGEPIGEPVNLGSDNTDLIEICIPVDTAGKDKALFAVYRVHEGVLHALPYDGETFSVEDGFIRLSVKRFSSYAIAYGAGIPSVTPPTPPAPPTPGSSDTITQAPAPKAVYLGAGRFETQNVKGAPTQVKVNGEPVEFYPEENGFSVSLPELAPGRHSLTVVWGNSRLQTYFDYEGFVFGVTVPDEMPMDIPKTGENSRLGLCLGLMMLLGGAVILGIGQRKKYKR